MSTRRRFTALLKKESLQILRDPSALLIAVVLPLILLFLFGEGISLDANKIALGLVVERESQPAQSLAAAFRASRFFTVREGRDRRELEGELVAGRLRAMVIIPASFGEDFASAPDSAGIQIIADGSNPNTAKFAASYAKGVWQSWRESTRAQTGAPAPLLGIETRVWFNPELKSRYFLVPGSIAIIMTLIGTLLTALVVAREWERGTMEAMMATPIGVAELLAGKLIPYFVLGLASMTVCTVIAVTLFEVPVRGSFFALLVIASAFLFPSLGQGLLISAAAKNQYVAAQAAMLSGFLPAMLLSGFIFEIDSMPRVIQWISYLVPARYLIPCLQSVFVAGDIWSLFLPNIAIMLLIGGVFFALAARNTRKRLD